MNEELARQALTRLNEEKTKSVPQGLLKNYQPEKKVDEFQMADFSTPIEEVMQNEVMGNPYETPQAPSISSATAMPVHRPTPPPPSVAALLDAVSDEDAEQMLRRALDALDLPT